MLVMMASYHFGRCSYSCKDYHDFVCLSSRKSHEVALKQGNGNFGKSQAVVIQNTGCTGEHCYSRRAAGECSWGGERQDELVVLRLHMAQVILDILQCSLME